MFNEQSSKRYAVARIAPPTYQDLLRTCALSISNAWGRAQVPSRAMRMFLNGNPYEGFVAMTAADGEVSSDFARGAAWMRDTLVGLCTVPTERFDKPATKFEAYESGRHDAVSQSLAVIKAVPIPQITATSLPLDAVIRVLEDVVKGESADMDEVRDLIAQLPEAHRERLEKLDANSGPALA